MLLGQPFIMMNDFLLTEIKHESYKIVVDKYIRMTWFQLMVPVVNHNVTQNLTGRRMHVEGSQTYQMNRQTYSFQNTCDMLLAKNFQEN